MIAANQRPRNVGLRAMRALSASITREAYGGSAMARAHVHSSFADE
jgi:methylmalonyl-CoA mutase N-terminal domain/subunit